MHRPRNCTYMHLCRPGLCMHRPGLCVHHLPGHCVHRPRLCVRRLPLRPHLPLLSSARRHERQGALIRALRVRPLPRGHRAVLAGDLPFAPMSSRDLPHDLPRPHLLTSTRPPGCVGSPSRRRPCTRLPRVRAPRSLCRSSRPPPPRRAAPPRSPPPPHLRPRQTRSVNGWPRRRARRRTRRRRARQRWRACSRR